MKWRSFFHQEKRYNGGPEYGWVFYEKLNQGRFYVMTDANLEGQKAAYWGVSGWDTLKAEGDVDGVYRAIHNLSKEQYWNIKVLENGDFKIEIVDPNSYETKSCIIKKPDFFPNLHNVDGYVTANAQKFEDSGVRPATLYIKEVKTI